MALTRNEIQTDDDIVEGLRVTLTVFHSAFPDLAVMSSKRPGEIVALERSETGKVHWIDVRLEDNGDVQRAIRDNRGRRVFYGNGARAIIVDVHHAFTPDFADEEAA